MNRLIACLCVGFIAWGSVIAAAPISDSLSPAWGSAVARGLGYLARQQQADGSFGGFEEVSPPLRTTAKVVVAMLAAGQTPTDGKHALVVRNATAYLLREAAADGSFGSTDGSGMLGQAWVMLAFAESYGLEADAAQRAQTLSLLKAGLAVSLASQDRAGGWNDQGQGDGNLVTTALMVLSLNGARGSGLIVPDDAMQRAAGFARSGQRKGQSGFAEKGQPPRASSTAAGICILLLTNSAKPAEVKDAMKFLLDHKIGEESIDLSTSMYLATLAHSLAEDPDWGKHWAGVWDRIRKEQGDDGNWPAPQADNPTSSGVGATADALLTLTVPSRLLPVYGNGRR